MTTATERTHALINAGNMLEEIAVCRENIDVDEIRRRAQYILRHFPSNMEIALIAEALTQGTHGKIESLLDSAAVPHTIQSGYRRW